MSIAVTMLIDFVYHLLGAVELAMLVRAILSWVMPDAGGAIVTFLYAVTEPFISVIRRLLDRLSLNVNSPIDLSFTITAVLIEIMRIFIVILL